MVHVEILLNFGNYFRTLQFLSLLSTHYIGLFFLHTHSILPKPRAFNHAQKSIGTPKFYRVLITFYWLKPIGYYLSITFLYPFFSLRDKEWYCSGYIHSFWGRKTSFYVWKGSMKILRTDNPLYMYEWMSL